jgi:hypothetical protein
VLALAAGNGGAALIGVVLPGRFDDAMRVAVVRRYPGCRASVRALCLSLVMLGLIDSAALAPLAFACAGAAAAALPIGPAGAATQVGASGAALIASGVGSSQALSVAVSVGALGIFSGAAIFLVAVAWPTGLALARTRVAA